MILGAAIGAVASIFNQGVSIYRDNQQAKIDERRRSDELEMAKLTASSNTQIASYKHDTDGGQASLWVVDLLRLVRPAITFYALALISIFYFYASEIDRGLIIASVLDVASMSVAWWFGSRDLRR